MPGAKKRNRLPSAPPTWDVVRGMLHMRLKEVAAELKVPISYLRRLCKENGHPTWPGKKIRLLNRIGLNPMLEEDAPESSSSGAGSAGLLQLATVAEQLIPEAVVNPPPREELVTLNLIDKVGSSSVTERN